MFLVGTPNNELSYLKYYQSIVCLRLIDYDWVSLIAVDIIIVYAFLFLFKEEKKRRYSTLIYKQKKIEINHNLLISNTVSSDIVHKDNIS